jgi:sugar phosphate isomerase/epimerase
VEHLAPGQGTITWPAFFETLHDIGFDGAIAVDVGGAESNIGNLDLAYKQSAAWLTEQWLNSDRSRN